MAATPRVLSADDHIQEPPDLWTSRLSKKKWGGRVPHLVRQSNGRDRWVIDGKVLDKPLLAPMDGAPFEPKTWAEVPESTYEPKARLQAMDRDGVHGQVLYPWVSGVSGEVLAGIEDAKLQEACIRAYNDWLLDTWASASDRFIPQCVLPVTSVRSAVKEMERAVAKGHRAAIMHPIPWHINKELPHLYLADWDPFWAKAVELDVPICWHSGAWDEMGMMDLYEKAGPLATRSMDNIRRPQGSNTILGNFIFMGIPERFPELKVIFAASGVNWVSFLLEVSDYEWDRICRRGILPYPMDMAPSLVFRRNCHVTMWFEKAGLSQRSYLGVNNILWQSEFPIDTSTWPRSKEVIKRNFAGIPQADRDKILGGNVARLYKLPA